MTRSVCRIPAGGVFGWYTGYVALRVRLLGGLAIDGVEVARLGSRKGRRLVSRLALEHGRPVAADSLADVLWPGDELPSNPHDQLSVLVSRARAVLGNDRVPRMTGGYALLVDWLDVEAMIAMTTRARRCLALGKIGPARAAADAALALDRGRLLPEEGDAAWLATERAITSLSVSAARMVAADVMLAGGDPWSAARIAGRALSEEAFDEAALRALMRALVACGRPARALNAYADFAKQLRAELGVEPSAASQAAYASLVRA